MDMTVDTPEVKPPVAHPVEAPATLGHVRQRDEDMDDEPVYKRARVDQNEEAMPPPAPATEPAAPPAEALPAPPKVDYGSKPMTNAQHKYLLESVRKAKKIKSALPFLNPVDPVALKIPKYPEIIKNPMDLGTMEEKLKAQKYGTPNDFWADFETMIQNSVTFNGPHHTVSVFGMSLNSYFAKLMSTLPKGDILESAKPKKVEAPPRVPPRRESRSAAKPAPPPAPPAAPKAPKEEHKPFLDPNGMPIIRRDSTTDRPKRDIVKPVRDLPYVNPKPKKKKTLVELRFCEWVNKEIFLRKHSAYAYPFTVPVDPVALNIPNYHRIIKKPMDFGTIKDNLKNGSYASAKEYHADAKLVFANCYKFNTPEDDVTRMGHQLEAVFDDLWTNKDQWIADNAPPSEPASELDDDDEDESEEEDDGEQLRRMQEIQQQIAALSAEALRLTSSTTKLPKPVKKKSKSSGGSQKPKRSSSGLSGKSKAQKKKKSPRKLTLAQKRYVSEGISVLDEPTMRQAVQMIRNGVPSLRVSSPTSGNAADNLGR
jgi:bromodomain-containing factor 1